MKRTITLGVAVAALAACVYLHNGLWAQNTGQPAGAAPAQLLRNKLAIFNMNEVIKNYQKWKNFEESMKGTLKEQQVKYDKMKNDLVAKQNDLQKLAPTDVAKRDPIERDVRALQRQLQDMGEELSKYYSKLEQDQITTIYKDIESTVQDMAKAYQIELILHYTDAVTEADKYHPANLARKLQGGGCMPIYKAPGIDITSWLLDNLNRRYSANNNATPPNGANK